MRWGARGSQHLRNGLSAMEKVHPGCRGGGRHSQGRGQSHQEASAFVSQACPGPPARILLGFAPGKLPGKLDGDGLS